MQPPPVLPAIAHPVRWRLLHELGRSDRRVHELTELVEQPQNGVSYHLAKLRDVGLVSGRRSAADGRDTYYRLELPRLRALFAEAGQALHPGLHPRGAGPCETPPTSVLFLCTGNSARSRMAEAMAASRSGGRIVARSAGSHPKPLHPAAARVLRERYAIELPDHDPTLVDDLLDQRFERVVTLCDRVREVCPTFPGAPDAAHWSLPDPSTADDGDDAFHRIAAELEDRIDFLLAELARPGDPTTDGENP